MTNPAANSVPAAGLPVLVEMLAADVVAIYTNAEQQLLTDLARIAARGLDDRLQVVMLGEMRRAAERLATQLRLRSGGLAQQIADTAARAGDAAAIRQMRRIIEGDPRLAKAYLAAVDGVTGHGLAAATQVGIDLAGRLNAVTYRIVRFADDAYQAAVAEAAGLLLRGNRGLTPAGAQQYAWRQLTARGVTGYTDSAGRNWNLATYVEMATRTAVQRAYNAAHEARLTAIGVRYFTISHDGHPCPICRPWEGVILSTGPVGPQVEAAADNGRPVAFTVKATLDDARAAGLFHPNCRHTVLPYLPGVTKTSPPARWTRADQAAYDATQQLRALERTVRAHKREQAAALDDLARTRAARKIRRTQAAIRAHVARHQLVRRPRREQLHLGHPHGGH